MKATWRDRCVYWAARVAIGTAARVPQWLGYGAASALGRLWFRCDRRRRGYALRLLRNAFPAASDAERLAIGARATGNLFKVPLDMARLTRLLARGGDLRAVLDIRPAQAQLAGLQPPYLGLTAHLGNWEVAAVGVAHLAGGAHGMARIARNPLLERWILANRERGGLVIHPRRGGVRDLSRALAAGRAGLQVVDQNQRLRGVFAPFFGERASCERAAVTLALRRGYPILVGAALRRGRGFSFELVAEPPFTLAATGDHAADVQRGVERVNAALEALIRRAPDQYLWIPDRYRTQPSAEAAADSAEADEERGARRSRAAPPSRSRGVASAAQPSGIAVAAFGAERRPRLPESCRARSAAPAALARPPGIEPGTAALEKRCSVRLSYGRLRGDDSRRVLAPKRRRPRARVQAAAGAPCEQARVRSESMPRRG